MRHAFPLALLAAAAIALVPQAGAREQRAQGATRTLVSERKVIRHLLGRITVHRDETWRWQRVMQRRRTPYGASVRRARSVAYGKWALRLWRNRAAEARQRARHPPHRREWLCIHRYEGSWRDTGAPYYGGLQMDIEFQATYGRELLRRKGTAEHWTPLEQMWVAERAYRTRGFWPWPNTARFCGLL